MFDSAGIHAGTEASREVVAAKSAVPLLSECQVGPDDGLAGEVTAGQPGVGGVGDGLEVPVELVGFELVEAAVFVEFGEGVRKPAFAGVDGVGDGLLEAELGDFAGDVVGVVVELCSFDGALLDLER